MVSCTRTSAPVFLSLPPCCARLGSVSLTGVWYSWSISMNPRLDASGRSTRKEGKREENGGHKVNKLLMEMRGEIWLYLKIKAQTERDKCPHTWRDGWDRGMMEEKRRFGRAKCSDQTWAEVGEWIRRDRCYSKQPTMVSTLDFSPPITPFTAFFSPQSLCPSFSFYAPPPPFFYFPWVTFREAIELASFFGQHWVCCKTANHLGLCSWEKL